MNVPSIDRLQLYKVVCVWKLTGDGNWELRQTTRLGMAIRLGQISNHFVFPPNVDPRKLESQERQESTEELRERRLAIRKKRLRQRREQYQLIG